MDGNVLRGWNGWGRGKNDSVAHLGVPHCRKRLIVCGLGAQLTKFQICHFKAKSTWFFNLLSLKNQGIFRSGFGEI
jgi:hypothetical protein